MIGYLFFWVQFLIFYVRFRFSEKVINFQFVDRFPLFFDPFPHILGQSPRFYGGGGYYPLQDNPNNPPIYVTGKDLR